MPIAAICPKIHMHIIRFQNFEWQGLMRVSTAKSLMRRCVMMNFVLVMEPAQVEKAQQMAAINDAFSRLRFFIKERLPESAERSSAISALNDARHSTIKAAFALESYSKDPIFDLDC